MKYNNEIEFEHNILKNIYIIYILQDFFKDDSDIHILGNIDSNLNSVDNSMDEILFSFSGGISNIKENILDNQKTSVDTLFKVFDIKKENRDLTNSINDKNNILELSNNNQLNEEEKKSEQKLTDKISNDNLNGNIVVQIENENTKKILFKCNIFNNDKNRIKELEENLVNNNIKGYTFFKRNDLNEKVINDMKFSKKKRYRRTKAEMIKIKEEEKNNPKIELKKGRIKNIDKTLNINNIVHNKISIDNIIKKVKCKYFEYTRKTVNLLIDKYKTNKNKKYELLKLDYKLYVDQLNKELDLNLLNMTLKVFLSLKISSKYKEHPKDENKKTIEQLLNDEKNNEVIIYIMNLTFNQWIDMFRHKKSKNINGNIVEFEGIDDVINEINNKNKEQGYIGNFMYALFYYEDWFKNKVGRKKKENKDLEIK